MCICSHANAIHNPFFLSLCLVSLYTHLNVPSSAKRMQQYSLRQKMLECVFAEKAINDVRKQYSVSITQILKLGNTDLLFLYCLKEVRKRHLWCHNFIWRKGQKMVRLKKNKSDCMRKTTWNKWYSLLYAYKNIFVWWKNMTLGRFWLYLKLCMD